jgi:DNA-binding transcriptional ArsR family regulator
MLASDRTSCPGLSDVRPLTLPRRPGQPFPPRGSQNATHRPWSPLIGPWSVWIQGLREEENDFLEGGSEEVLAGGRVFYRFAPRGNAWAASLAAAVRPHVFGLGTAPVAFAGLAPRELFRESRERSSQVIMAEALEQAARAVADDLIAVHSALRLAGEQLADLYASSQAPAVWKLVACLGPLTRAEVARALGVTRRTASQAAVILTGAGLAHLRCSDQVLAALELNGVASSACSARL